MEKIDKLRQAFKSEKINGYLISKNDEFFCEYVHAQNDRLNFISNFTGSYGFSLIMENNNYLLIDGRYTLQAKKQCGEYHKIITFPNRIPDIILKNKRLVIGFDPKMFTRKTLDFLFFKNKCYLKPIEKNLIDKIWKRKLPGNDSKYFSLSNKFTGENFKSKINKVVSYIKRKNADFLLVTASENSAWLLNIRGKDAEFSPLPFSYILVDKKKNIKFFCDIKKLSLKLRKYLEQIEIKNINSLNQILLNITKKRFIIDNNTCSIFFESSILKNNRILNLKDPIYDYKSVKNRKEIFNIKKTHIQDGIALTKYLFWLKKNFLKRKITEISASQKLLYFRKQNRNFQSLSFPTISGTGSNGAIIHYKATKETNKVLKKGDIYLVDSGGQYKYGTTDVTRTISLNNYSKKIRNIFTRVLKGHIAVAQTELTKNSSGSLIDIKARQFLKQIGLNYPHGTGHGVGFFLNVHEGPHAISKNNKVKFKEGMVVSNEPGYYEKEKFGLRIENLIYVKRNKNKKIFKNLTMVPIDKELININLLNEKEKKWLNEYHEDVLKNLKHAMTGREILDLEKACSAI
tara:strand:- start:427 stop:2145 length:1719 start_codon:yes stop_codon:yes gene_type:complete